MRSKLLAAGSALLLVAGLTSVGAAPAFANDQVCSSLDSGKVDVSGAHKTVPITAPDGMLIDSYCAKAGSAKQGDGPEYFSVTPAVKAFTLEHTSGKDISHWSISYVAVPDISRDAAASVSTTSATCITGQTLVLGATSHATWGTPNRTAGPGSYDVTATADSNHLFADGNSSKNFTGTLSGPLTDGSVCGGVDTKTLVTPQASMTNLGCTTGGSYTLNAIDGVLWSVDGESVAAGTYTANTPGTVQVTAAAKGPDFGLQLGTQTAWTFAFTTAELCGDLDTHPLVTPLASTTNLGCTTGGSYTLNAIDGVLWSVDGAPATAGTYTVNTPGTVQVTAAADGPDYGLEFDAQTAWTFEFTTAEACGDLGTLALTGAQSSQRLLFSGGMLLLLLGSVILVMSRRKGLGVA